MRMHTLVRQLLEDMTAKERVAFHTLLLMDMSESMYRRSENGWESYNAARTLTQLFPNRKRRSGVYKHVLLFDRVVMKVDIVEDRWFGSVQAEVAAWRNYAKKNGKLADGIYLAPTHAITQNISVQLRIGGRATNKDCDHLENTVGWSGKGMIGDIHQGNFRRMGDKIFVIDFSDLD